MPELELEDELLELEELEELLDELLEEELLDEELLDDELLDDELDELVLVPPQAVSTRESANAHHAPGCCTTVEKVFMSGSLSSDVLRLRLLRLEIEELKAHSN